MLHDIWPYPSILPPNNLCELHLSAKHKTLLGGDRVLGVAVLPLKSLQEGKSYTIELAPSLPLTDRGKAFLTILSQRNTDEMAREFSQLKTQQRTEVWPTNVHVHEL